jgi:hypothetical protein
VAYEMEDQAAVAEHVRAAGDVADRPVVHGVAGVARFDCVAAIEAQHTHFVFQAVGDQESEDLYTVVDEAAHCTQQVDLVLD